jgi:NADH-quinone oxidoreductase subunit G
MVQRGEFSEITTFVGKTIDSELSGNMIDICPVGALTSKPFRYSARNWELSRLRTVSPHDGLGSNLIAQVKGERVMRVVPFENEAINECWLSDKDRFSYEGLDAPDRLTRPMIKQDDTWREVDWQVALEFAAKGLARVRSEHGAASIGAVASPHSTLEELHLLQKLVRALGSENIDANPRRADPSLARRLAGAPWLGMSINDFGALDRALVLGSFLRKDQPLLAQRLRQAVRRGARVMVVNASADDWLMPIAARATVAPSQWLDALSSIAAAIAAQKGVAAPRPGEADDNARSIAKLLQSGERRAIVLGSTALAHPDAAQIIVLAQWIAQAVDARVSLLADAANTVGAHLARAYPGEGGLSTEEQFAQPRHAYVLLNIEPELDVADPHAAHAALLQASLVIVMSAFKGDATDYADVLLPIVPFSETSGTFINNEALAQSFNAVVRPLGEARPGWKVLRVLGNLLDLKGFDQESSESVREEVLKGETELAARCSNAIEGDTGASARTWTGKGAFERVADVPIYFADALVRRAPALQKTKDAAAPLVHLRGAAAARLGLSAGDQVRVSQGAAGAVLPCAIDDTLAEGTVRISAAHASTATLGAMFGAISLEKPAGGA